MDLILSQFEIFKEIFTCNFSYKKPRLPKGHSDIESLSKITDEPTLISKLELRDFIVLKSICKKVFNVIKVYGFIDNSGLAKHIRLNYKLRGNIDNLEFIVKTFFSYQTRSKVLRRQIRKGGDMNVITSLLKIGIPNKIDGLFQIAVENGNFRIVQFLVNWSHSNFHNPLVNFKDIRRATFEGVEDITEYVIDKLVTVRGVRPEYPRDKPLCNAVLSKQFSTCKTLLKYENVGHNIYCKDLFLRCVWKRNLNPMIAKVLLFDPLKRIDPSYDHSRAVIEGLDIRDDRPYECKTISMFLKDERVKKDYRIIMEKLLVGNKNKDDLFTPYMIVAAIHIIINEPSFDFGIFTRRMLNKFSPFRWRELPPKTEYTNLIFSILKKILTKENIESNKGVKEYLRYDLPDKIKGGNCRLFERILDVYPDIVFIDNIDQIVTELAKKCDRSIFKKLLDAGYNPVINTTIDSTPHFEIKNLIIFAAKFWNHDVVKLLLKDGRVDPTEHSNYALKVCSQEIQNLLLSDERVQRVEGILYGKRIESIKKKRRLFIKAIEEGDFQAVKEFVDDEDFDPSFNCNEGINTVTVKKLEGKCYEEIYDLLSENEFVKNKFRNMFL